MSIKQQIETDIKKAMLAGDKTLVTTLRGLKSTILYAEVASGARDKGLDEQTVITLLQKEAKKRHESAALFRQGNNNEKAAAEEQEAKIIAQYLPAQLDSAELESIVRETVKKLGLTERSQMGQLIGAVKQQVGATANGADIARLAKECLE